MALTTLSFIGTFITRWLPGIEQQSTDIHYRSLNGEGMFNWRFKFPFSYNKTENIIVHNEKYLFSWYDEEQHVLPRLHLQIWDNDRITPDSYIGIKHILHPYLDKTVHTVLLNHIGMSFGLEDLEDGFLNLDLWNMPKGTKSSRWCTMSNSVPRINLFKIKKARGWWPFVSTKDNKNLIVGKLDAEIQIITKQEADTQPAGLGRDGPQPLPEPKRPSTHYMEKFTGLFTGKNLASTIPNLQFERENKNSHINSSIHLEPVTSDEIILKIDLLKNNIAPGSDKITVEFQKTVKKLVA
ncbi:C2 domain,Ferlin, C-terminal domain, partial [Cinara cedri]